MKRCYANVTIWANDEEGFNEACEVLEHSMRNLETHEGKIEDEDLELKTPYYTINGTIQYDGRSEEMAKADELYNAKEDLADDKRKYPEDQ